MGILLKMASRVNLTLLTVLFSCLFLAVSGKHFLIQTYDDGKVGAATKRLCGEDYYRDYGLDYRMDYRNDYRNDYKDCKGSAAGKKRRSKDYGKKAHEDYYS